MKEILKFLKELADNNNREWMTAHKAEYKQQKARFDTFVEKLIAGIRQFDPSIGQLSVADCTYRIYRDTRFSADKTPYKTHMGAFIAPGGKKSGYSGYYFQIGAETGGYSGGCMLATGNYYCDSKVLRLLREDIALDDGHDFKAALDAASSFELDWEGCLKRIPAGFDPDAPYSQWLRLRNFCLVRDTGYSYVTAPKLLDRLLTDFRSTKPFLDLINRAVAYAADPDNK